MMEDWVKIIIYLGILACWVANLVKLFTSALSDQIGLAIVHSVGLLGPLSVITVWF
jgi:hypothetical protein